MAVPVALIAERRVIARLMRANAVSPQHAHQLDGLRWIQARRLQRLLDAGVVLEPQPGRYYLDLPSLADRLESRRHRIAVFLAIVIGLMGVVLYWQTPAGAPTPR
jgi:hypothetical protein